MLAAKGYAVRLTNPTSTLGHRQVSGPNLSEVFMQSIDLTSRGLAVIALSAIGLLLTACASSPQTLGEPLAESAIKQAEAAEADVYAPLQLRTAKEKMQRARRLHEGKDHDQANRLEQQAHVDAELAELQARSAKTDKAMTEIHENMRLLRQELERLGSS